MVVLEWGVNVDVIIDEYIFFCYVVVIGKLVWVKFFLVYGV